MTREELIKKIIYEAADIALSYTGKISIEQKENQSIITEADKEIEKFFRRQILDKFPQDKIIGEEVSEKSLKNRDNILWIIDPIDGTASYSSGLPLWSISVACFDSDGPRFGAIYLPRVDEFYFASRTEPVTRNNKNVKMRYRPDFDKESLMLVSSNAHRIYELKFPGKTRSLGSTATNLAYLVSGAADAVLLGRPNIWDIAAGLCLLIKAGGEIISIDGENVNIDRWIETGIKPEKPLIAGHIEIIKKIAPLVIPKVDKIDY